MIIRNNKALYKRCAIRLTITNKVKILNKLLIRIKKIIIYLYSINKIRKHNSGVNKIFVFRIIWFK